jgi:hypothetical protein
MKQDIFDKDQIIFRSSHYDGAASGGYFEPRLYTNSFIGAICVNFQRHRLIQCGPNFSVHHKGATVTTVTVLRFVSLASAGKPNQVDT